MNLASLQSRGARAVVVAGLGVSGYFVTTALLQRHHRAKAQEQSQVIADSKRVVDHLEGEKAQIDKQAVIHEGEQTTAEVHATTHKRELAHLVAGLATVKQLPPESKAPEQAGALLAAAAALEKAQEVIADQDQQITALKAENADLKAGNAKRDEINWELQKQLRATTLMAEEYQKATTGHWGAGATYRPAQLGQPGSYGGFMEREIGRGIVMVNGDRQGVSVGIGIKFGRH